MLTLLLALLVATPTEVVYVVETLDGESLTGKLVAWSDENVTLRTAEGASQQVPLPRVQRLAPQRVEAPSVEPPTGRLQVELTDGSQLTLRDIATEGTQATLVAPDGVANRARLEVPLSAIRSVRQRLEASEPADRRARLDQQWNEITEMNPAGDLIVVRKPAADTINYVAGAIGHVGKDKIAFTLDEQEIEVDREKVFGWIYYRAAHDSESKADQVVLRGHGYRVVAEDVSWNEGKWVIASAQLGNLELSGERLESIDLSAGKVLYLSDLEPRRAEWSPPPTLPLVANLLEGYARDRGFLSPRLWLEYPPESLDQSEATSAGISRRVEFRKGLAIRGHMELAYRLPGEYRHFRAVAGIDPHARAAGGVVLRIVGDGRELVKQTIGGHDAPHEIACSVEGIRQLELVVEFQKENPLAAGSGGTLHLGHARLTR